MNEDGELARVRREIDLEKKARRILGVGPEADEAEIKKTFWRLAMENHPDKFPRDNEREQHFLLFLAAYEYLVKDRGGGELDRIRRDYRAPDDLLENPWKYFAWWREQFY